MRILVVEDEPLTRALFAKELASDGYSVVQAANATEAIDIISAGDRFDLVLTDVIMPGLFDGFELAEFVKDVAPRTKVIVVSGYDRANGARTDIDLFIDKPTTAHHLRREVARALGLDRLIDQTGAS